MKRKFKILLVVILSFGFLQTNAQNVNPVLFTDRDYCISGDTVWFKVLIPSQEQKNGNVVRVQLDNRNNNLISDVAVKSKNRWANGFIHIPDSLSTGQYFLTAFFNSQRNSEELELQSKSLLVYNRFAENISQMEIISGKEIQPCINNNSPLVLRTDKELYETREKVSVELKSKDGLKVTDLLIKANLQDPLAAEIEGEYRFARKSLNHSIPGITENDGILLSGTVREVNGKSIKDALVGLSVGGTIPYFDYYVLNEKGDFHFYLKDAVGNAKITLQVISVDPLNYVIQLEKNCLVRKNQEQVQVKILDYKQAEFVNTSLNAGFTQKLFYPEIKFQQLNGVVPVRFNMPFYGQNEDRIFPRDFIDLPDFREISRELLPGFQYRIRNDEVIFRMINNRYNTFFEQEPLRLINGIPVFKNELFVDLSSEDIDYIDIVKSERIFGDLIFKGVLAVYLKDNSNYWMNMQPNIFEFSVNLLQPEKSPGYLIRKNTETNFPDLRQVYFWKSTDSGSFEKFEFNLSDRKGNVEISAEGYMPNNEHFKISKIIEVK